MKNKHNTDDTTVPVESKDGMIALIKWITNNSDRVGLNLNLQKTTVMSTVENVNIFSDEDSSTATNYMLLVVLITNDSYTNEETKKRISLSKSAMAKFDKNQKRLGSFNQHKS